METYKAKSGISINVKLQSGRHKHVCFEMQSNGESIYTTSNQALATALDNDPRCGVLYRKEEQVKEERQQVREEEVKAQEVEVYCLDDAKQYLADKFGVPKSAMKKKADILDIAKRNGVLFTGDF